jgi:hypothetical protein
MRYKNYLMRYAATVKAVLDQRKAILMKPSQGNVMSNLESRYLTLPLMASASVKNLRSYDMLSVRSGLTSAQRYNGSFSTKVNTSSFITLPNIAR